MIECSVMSRVEEHKDFWTEAREAFIPDATNIIDLLSKSDGVIINGPHGIGKSHLLIPVVRDVASLHEMDLEVGFLEVDLIRKNAWGQELEDLTFDESIKGRRILVLDEAAETLVKEDAILEGAVNVFQDKAITPIIINAGSTVEARRSVSSQLELASKRFDFRFLTYELTITHLPSELVLRYLASWGANQDLMDFLSRPENSAFLTTRALSELYNYLIPDEQLSGIKKIRDLQQLRNFLQGSSTNMLPEWKQWILKRIGGSRACMLEGLVNLEVINPHSPEFEQQSNIGIDYS